MSVGGVLGAFLVFSSICIITNSEITRAMLYGSYSYNAASYGPIMKIFLMMVSFAWIAFFYISIPDKKIPWISVLGQHTLPIFLLHGFVVKLVSKLELFCYNESLNLFLAVILSIVLLCFCGNSWTAKMFGKLFAPRG